MRPFRLFARTLVVLFVVAGRLAAQDARDLLRGRVRGPDSAAIRNAIVSIVPEGAAVNAPPHVVRTDSTGNWSITMPGTAPTYAVTVTAIGMTPARVTARRTADGQPIVVNVTMQRAVVQLGTVRVQESRRRPPPREGTGIPVDQTAAERPVDFAPGAVSASDLGNLASMAASIPGVTLLADAAGGPPAFSVLGLSQDQNSVTLNGMQFSGGDIPRDAVAFTRLNSTSYDASRGGFSGGQLAIASFAGGNFSQQLAHITFDAPSFQFTDRVGRQLGSQYTNAQVSGSTLGAFMLDKVFYNVALQVGRRNSDLQSLLVSDQATLQRVGVAQDSVQRLTSSLSRLGIPIAAGVPGSKVRDNQSVLARFDYNPSPTVQSNLVTSIRRSNSSALFLGATAVPAHGGDENALGGDVTGTLSALIHKNILSDTRVGGHYNRTKSSAYADLPDARVLVTSQLADGSMGLTSLQFGGNGFLPRRANNAGAELFQQVSWLSESGTHRWRTTLNVRDDQFSQDQYPNRLGSYVFNSIADVEANRPASFTRTFVSQNVSASAINSAFSLGDSWRPTGKTQFLYGFRAEGIHFNDAPAYNPTVESVFGVRTDHTPSEWHVSPRVGFFWGIGDRGTKGIRGAPLYTLRGGIGEFRNSTPVTMIAPALRATGLADAVHQMQCIGSAVPFPDWNAFAQDPSTIPSTCANGAASSFVSTQPNVYLIAKDFAAQRSWRGNFAVQGPLVSKWLVLQVEGIVSNNLNQQSPLDLNFNPQQRFTLDAEGGRPVYAAATSIVPGTGAVTNRDSRRASQFSSVTELTSNLRSTSRQVIATLTPLTFLPGFTWNLSYVHQSVRDQARGFGAATAGNPLDIEWGRSPLDARHQINGSITLRVRNDFSVAFWSRFSSGTPFTPVIAGDVNGDGLSNDRAFIFAPATSDSALRAGMSTLLGNAPSRVRECLTRQQGHIAERNSCEGPWTATTNAVITLNPEKLKLQNRVLLTLSLANLAAGFDQLLHGSSNLQGWGQPSFSDPTLLTVRGFDPATNRFKYEVNQRFGDTRPARTGTRAPFLMTLEARVQLGRIFTTQAVDQAMSPGRSRGGDKLTATQLLIRAQSSVFNPLGQLLAVKDSLSFITKEQLQQLTDLQRRVAVQQDSIWNPVTEYLVRQPKEYSRQEVLERVLAAQLKMFDGIVLAMREVKTILSAEQIRELPPFMLTAFDEKSLLQTRPTLAFFPAF